MIEHLGDSAFSATPRRQMSPAALAPCLTGREKRVAAWIEANHFSAASGKICIIPNGEGGIGEVLVGITEEDNLWPYGALPSGLPEATYRLVEDGLDETGQNRAAVGWEL